MRNSKLIIILIAVSVLFLYSCSTLSNKEQKNLENKEFYLQKFTYVEKGINKQKAFKIMENLPAEKILKILRHKYNINIDTSEYEDSLASDDGSQLKVSGVFIDSDYVWENKQKNDNTIELEFRKDLIPTEGQFFDKLAYSIELKSNGKTKEKFLGDLFETVPPLFTIAKAMGYSRVSKDSDDKYVNNETKAIVDLTGSTFGKTISKAKAEKVSREKIKEDIRTYIKSLSSDDRKKFRDDIIKYLYKLIE